MLDLKKYFAIGDKIQIAFVDIRGNLKEYTTQVVEFKGNDFLDVLVPIYKTQEVSLKQDNVLKLITAKGDAIYDFKAVIHEKLFERIPLLRLKIISEPNKVQRRDSFRLRLMRDVDVRHVEDIKEKKLGEKFKCNLHDISAGGLLFSSNKELRDNDILELTIDLNGVQLTVYGNIVRKTRTISSRAPYAYGVRFERMSESEKNKITKFIFEEQRKLIKKGLI